MEILCETSDLLVFSHMRWDFVFRRSQHLMSRFAIFRRVFFFEEPIYGMTKIPRYHIRETPENVQVVTPYLPQGLSTIEQECSLMRLVSELVNDEGFQAFTLWYSTPTALAYTRHLTPMAVLYDFAEDLSKCAGAPMNYADLETELLYRADLVFTASSALHDVKKYFHHNIHHMPSSIDFEHFSCARTHLIDAEDQENIPHPRVGYFGVIDERLDLELLERMALQRRDWSFVLVGPIVNIDPACLPRHFNIFYLGKKDYKDLPMYISGWDATLLPFAVNELTRFLNPTQTLEYLAAGKPVISTPIQDIVHHYGFKKTVAIGETTKEFIGHIEKALQGACKADWQKQVDSLLSYVSWDSTWARMAELEWMLGGTRVMNNMHKYSPYESLQPNQMQ
ncbi:glycosyltransferase family 1 protein [Bdellovibrio sp. HCB337]|uniref:glycosyltransferase family 1 protein n=1 Tax=Bdellovibrio sp. HCB337 TaxID=3394358 RepID=UPI0039A6AE98